MNLELIRPRTVEELLRACVEKHAAEAPEEPRAVVEIVLGHEVMMDLALRLIALEARAVPDHREAAENRP